jgi:alkylated DNA repair protein alkB family protein 1
LVSGAFSFRPEAAIVNFYHMDSSIGGHTDHSEFDLSAPLLSFSFGQDAIFLLGKESRTIRPVAIRVGSGDVMIMAGPSRLSYHAVPRILRDSEFKCNIFVQDGQDDCNDVVDFTQLPCAPTGWNGVAKDSQLLLDFMHHSRINVNVRQVLPPGGTFPADVAAASLKSS